MSIATEMDLSLRAEYEHADLGDKRRTRRLCDMVDVIADRPEASFPTLFPESADLEAAYRLLRNGRVKEEAIRAAHRDKTAERAAKAGRVIVAHDTTTFNFGQKPREGLGRVGGGKSYGFYGHFSLAIEHSEERIPLGMVAMQTYDRTGKQKRRGKKASHREHQEDETNEGLRWFQNVEAATAALPAEVECIHTMDREGDSYALFADLMAHEERFVIRCAQDTRCTVGGEKLRAMLDAASVHPGTRTVHISKRDRSPLPSYRKHYPPRSARQAHLAISAVPVTLARPKSANRCPAKRLSLHLVRVFEPAPPAGEPAVEWLLWTTEPIDTVEQIWAIVDIYRTRWVIEEYFKALKTGCGYMARQLESAANLHRALALFVPVAWWLLLLRTVCRADPDRPATALLTRPQLWCLREALREMKITLPEAPPTVRHVLLGIARLGGHIPRNGEPGWIVLYRGMEKLMLMVQGYQLARKKM